MNTEAELLSRIERFCKVAGITNTRFGIKSVNDPSLVTDLKCGRELRQDTRNRVEKYMEKVMKKLAKAS